MSFSIPFCCVPMFIIIIIFFFFLFVQRLRIPTYNMPFEWNGDSISERIKTLNWDILPNKTILNIQLSNLNHFEENERVREYIRLIQFLNLEWMNELRKKKNSFFARNENVWPFFSLFFVGESNKYSLCGNEKRVARYAAVTELRHWMCHKTLNVCRQKQTHIYSVFFSLASNFQYVCKRRVN